MSFRSKFSSRFVFLFATALLGSHLFQQGTAAAEQAAAERIVAIGGSVTEIVYALGEEGRLIARDTTSTFPPEAKELPDVGYIRALSPEGVLSVSPDMILMLDGAGPPETLGLLAKSGIPIVSIPEDYSGEGILQKVQVIGEALGVTEKAKALNDDLRLALSTAAEENAKRTKDIKVLFVLSAKGGRILASGEKTAASGILKLVGAENAEKDFTGYKQLSDEAILEAAPDVILMMSNGRDHGASAQTLFDHPAVSLTPAGENKRLIQMPGNYLLGFGPRTPEVIHELAAKLTEFGG
ncbi:hemin ABC transporter substrate-binding protein [Roseibium polysiphoniae]|uniref:Hemin ABC transporter substrate-binding protein n=1 Tax=Roseibium polysiphoniae TaxID=2571221 RepID=A0A944GSV7_9HYPH|nr:ABC transporter substrate-binding protein [Roseibium polysiphoniae]MBS8260739.1 hemin ABC transporter substrate-binding protein [Roseibium polysiphoniae]